MYQSSEPRKLPFPDRRRHARQLVRAPVALEGEGWTLEGHVVNLSYSGALVQVAGELPAVGSACVITLGLPLGTVRAQGQVVRIDPRGCRLAVDLLRLEENAELLLAALLMAGDDEPAR